MSGWVAGRICAPITYGILVPPGFDRGLGPDHVFVDPPFASRPLEYLIRFAGEISSDARRDDRVCVRVNRAAEEIGGQALVSRCRIVSGVGPFIFGPKFDSGCLFDIARQEGARRAG